jgi:hypothetical protein
MRVVFAWIVTVVLYMRLAIVCWHGEHNHAPHPFPTVYLHAGRLRCRPLQNKRGIRRQRRDLRFQGRQIARKRTLSLAQDEKVERLRGLGIQGLRHLLASLYVRANGQHHTVMYLHDAVGCAASVRCKDGARKQYTPQQTQQQQEKECKESSAAYIRVSI